MMDIWPTPAPTVRRMSEPALVTEAMFLNTIIEAAHAYGWKIAHFRPGMTSRLDKKGNPVWVTPVQADGKGFPDLVCVSQPPMRPRLLLVEVKSDGRRLSPEQKEWLGALVRCATAGGVGEDSVLEVYTWRPRDWDDIVRILGE